MTDVLGMTADQVREEARRRADRRAKNLPLTETPAEREQRIVDEDFRLEREIQAECVRLYRANGFTVWEGLKDKRKTKIQPGHPDLTLFHVRLKWHGYQEVKTPTGELRPDQKDFREVCIASGVPHFVGGVQIAQLVIAEVLGLR